MTNSNTTIPTVALAALILSFTGAASATIISNGDFESPGVSGLTTTIPTGWTFSGLTNGSRGLRDNGPLTTSPPDLTHGDFWFQNNFAGNTALLTQVTGETIVAGSTYTLTFDLGEQDNNATFTSALGRVLLYGDATGIGSPFAVMDNIDGGATVGPNGSKWTTFQLSFIATAGQAGEKLGVALGLAALNPAANVSYDNISLAVTAAPVPEPGSVTLFTLGGLTMLSVHLVRRRRRRA